MRSSSEPSALGFSDLNFDGQTFQVRAFGYSLADGKYLLVGQDTATLRQMNALIVRAFSVGFFRSQFRWPDIPGTRLRIQPGGWEISSRRSGHRHLAPDECAHRQSLQRWVFPISISMARHSRYAPSDTAWRMGNIFSSVRTPPPCAR